MRIPHVISLAAISALVVAGSAAAASPSVSLFRLHAPTAAPGTLVGVARVVMPPGVGPGELTDAQGNARRIAGVLELAKVQDGSTPRRRARYTLVARDTVRVKRDAGLGNSSVLYFRFGKGAVPRGSKNAPKYRVRLRAGFEGMPLRPVRAARGTRHVQTGVGQGCWPLCTPSPGPPPAPPVALAGQMGTTAAMMCVFFDGPGVTGPYVEYSEIGAAEWFFSSGVSLPIAPDGAFSGAGYEQQAGNLLGGSWSTTLSGTVSSGAVSGGSGTAVLGYSGGPVHGIATSVPLVTSPALEQQQAC